jgi:hypothetical protein
MAVENVVGFDDIEMDKHHIQMLIIIIEEVWFSFSSKKQI